MKNSSLIAIFCLLSFSTLSQSAPVIASDGVNMGYVQTGRIYGMYPLMMPSTNPVAYPFGWLTPNTSLANCVAPISNFIGQKSDGSPMAYLDLIPLTTSSIFVEGIDGEVVLDSGNEGTVLGGRVTMLEPQGDISMGIYQ